MKLPQVEVGVEVEIEEPRGVLGWLEEGVRLYCYAVTVALTAWMFGESAGYVRPVFEAGAIFGAICAFGGLLIKWGVMQLVKRWGQENRP